MYDFQEWEERARVARELAALARAKAKPEEAENFTDQGNRRLNDLADLLEHDAEVSERIARDINEDDGRLLAYHQQQDINGA